MLKIRGGGGGGDGGSGGVAPTVSWSSGILHNGSWSSGGSQITMRKSWSSAIAIASIAPIAGIAAQMRDATGGQLQSGCSGSIVSAIGDGSRSGSGSIVSTSVGQGGRSSIVTTIGGQASSMTGSGQLDLSCGRSVSHGGVAGLRSD